MSSDLASEFSYGAVHVDIPISQHVGVWRIWVVHVLPEVVMN